MPRYHFDPATATTATDADEAVALAVAWADGRRSWTNLIMLPIHDPGDERFSLRLEQQRTIAVMDSEQAQAWAAVAEAYAALERRPSRGRVVNGEVLP